MIDDATLLPTTLTRNGQEETLEILSGGTREQLAILTALPSPGCSLRRVARSR